jgi:hypothetical protein
MPSFNLPQAGKFTPIKYLSRETNPLPFDLIGKFDAFTDSHVRLPFFKSFASIYREFQTLNSSLNGIRSVRIKTARKYILSLTKSLSRSFSQSNILSFTIKYFYFSEVTSTSLLSMPEGSFNFDPSEHTGEWTFISLQKGVSSSPFSTSSSHSGPDSADNTVKLSGSLRTEIPLSELPSIEAVVSLRIAQYSFTGSVVEKVACYTLAGGG